MDGDRKDSDDQNKNEELKNSNEGQSNIDKAIQAREENRTAEALDLYKKEIEHLIQEIKDESMVEEVKNKLKRQCSIYLSEAEILQKELNDENGGGENDENGEETACKESEDHQVERLVNDMSESETPDITLEDVCGCQDVKDKLTESIILPIKFPHLFQGKRRPMWKGILLYGAPGSGKTMIIKALAGENPDVSFLRIVCSDLVSKFLEHQEKMVQYLFKRAKNQSPPCILFLDDFEQLFEYEESENDRIPRIRTELLYQIDNCPEKVHLVAGTHKPWMIQSTFLKLLRLNKRVLVPLPDHEARRQIFMKNMKPIKNDVKDYMIFADKTEGYTGADISTIVRDASMAPLRKIQNASHFKKVQGPSLTDPEVIVDDLLTPCASQDSMAIEMSWLDVSEDKLSEPTVTTDDVLKSLNGTKPSIDEEYLKKLNDFVQTWE
ncbi:vacuolar protein sorting-associated protein 4-like isoform X2 [Mytilus galloprovincialis]|uniref:vacuolar protein sorting-associated protein 4-like isoform X2 n=1 Tax=Mytilus galloprovincialis TaxID=29158 RepID=UPI003F7B92C2